MSWQVTKAPGVRRPPPRPCPGCQVKIAYRMIACDACWSTLPNVLRWAVLAPRVGSASWVSAAETAASWLRNNPQPSRRQRKVPDTP